MKFTEILSLKKSLKNSHENRKLLGNTIYLYLFQAINYLLPLVTVPYLVRVLGIEKFGIIAFYSAFIAYFQIIVDYGFYLSATRDAAMMRKDREKLSSLFYSVLIIKIVLVLICSAVLGVLLMSIPKLHQEIQLCSFLFLGVVGSVLFSNWLFQGLEQMGYITFFNLITKLISTLLIFVLIKRPEHYIRTAYLSAFASWIVGVISFIIAVRKFKLKARFPGWNECRHYLKEGFQIFVSQISVTLFTNTNTFLLGILTNSQVVGTYAIAEKIVRAAISLTGPVGSAIYPRSSALFAESHQRAILFLKKIALLGISVFGLLSVCLFLGADLAVLLITGHKSTEIALLIRIMAILPLSVFLDNIYGTQIMLNFDLRRQFMNIIVGGGLLSLCLLVILIPNIKANGSALSFLISEITMMVLMVVTVRKSGIRLFQSETR